MARSTSPTIAPGPADGFEVAIQASSTDLLLYDTLTTLSESTAAGMQPGTGPAITSTKKGFEVAFETNQGTLATYDSSNVLTDTLEQMAVGTSPSATRSAAGGWGWETTFQGPSGRLLTYGAKTPARMAVGTSPSIATTSATVSKPSSFPIYAQVASSSEDCFATVGDPLDAATSCTSWSATPDVASPGSMASLGDFCMDYGTDASPMDATNTANLIGEIGITPARDADQIMDPTTGTTCTTSGTSSRYGLLLQSALDSGFCLAGPCGIQHGVNFATRSLRPWFANGELLLGSSYDPVSDNVGTGRLPNSSWHSYMCPWIQDVTTTQGFQLCLETWRSDSGFPALCPDQVAGANVCTTDGVVQTVCDEDVTGYDECVSPGFSDDSTIVWTRPQAGTVLATNVGAPYVGGNTFGRRSYAVAITQANLAEVVRLINLALAMDKSGGHDAGTAPFSPNPSDYAVTAVEDGDEGIENFGSPSASLGSNVGNLSVTSQY
jgi:hypothetical protein